MNYDLIHFTFDMYFVVKYFYMQAALRQLLLREGGIASVINKQISRCWRHYTEEKKEQTSVFKSTDEVQSMFEAWRLLLL